LGDATHGMAGTAAETIEKHSPLKKLCRRRLAHWLREPGEPRVELGARQHDDVERHERVLLAAVFGALSAEHAGAIGADHLAVDATGNEVGLPGEVRDPEAVDDVVRAEQ
jgi:hypothetical protein